MMMRKIAHTVISFIITLSIATSLQAQASENDIVKAISGCWNVGAIEQPIRIDVQVEPGPNGLDKNSVTLIGEYTQEKSVVEENFDAARRAIYRCNIVNCSKLFIEKIFLTFDPTKLIARPGTPKPISQANNEIKDDYRVLLSHPIEGSIPLGLNFYLTKASKSGPSINDKYEKDPFKRGKEFDRYVSTYVSCRLNLFLSNETPYDIAFRDPFVTVVGLRFKMPNSAIIMQGNVGMSTMFRGLSNGNQNILKSGDFAQIEFVSMNPVYFDSRLEAERWARGEYCDFSQTISIERYGIMGEIMIENERDWRSFDGSFGIILKH